MYGFNYLVHTSRSGISGPWGHSMLNSFSAPFHCFCLHYFLSQRRFLFLECLSTPVSVFLRITLRACEAASPCGLDLLLITLSVFSRPRWPFTHLLLRSAHSSPFPISTWGCLPLFYLSFKCSLHILYMSQLSDTAGPTYLVSWFPQFQLPVVSCGLKIRHGTVFRVAQEILCQPRLFPPGVSLCPVYPHCIDCFFLSHYTTCS